jgi:cytidylate kinase
MLATFATFANRYFILKNKINIAIDGYSSCGKSTLAKSVAKELNYIYVDTGAMYRAMTLYAINHSYINDNAEVDVDGLISALDKIVIHFKYNTDTLKHETFLNGENVEHEIRNPSVSSWVSPISAIKEVRKKLVALQQRMAEGRGVVMDGRDIGTVVLPDAELKIFMTADSVVRAKRRFEELRIMGVQTTVEEVLKNLNARDEYDTTRANDPLRRADDAIVLDNSHLSIDEQYVFVIKQAQRRIIAKTEQEA